MAPLDVARARLAAPPRVLSAILFAVLVFAIAVADARAESFPDACGGANNLDYATCERLDYLVTQEDDTQREVSWVIGVLIFTATVPIWRSVFRG